MMKPKTMKWKNRGKPLVIILTVGLLLVMLFVCGCNVRRALSEERLFVASGTYDDYRATVRWRLLPAVW